MRKNTVALQTTWNRPQLLSQSLPQVLREADSSRIPLVISDDQSDDLDTIALLEEAKSRGVDVIRREYSRDGASSPHDLTQLNAIFAFKHVLKHYPDVEFILKLDDDIFIDEGTFEVMDKAFIELESQGEDVLGVAGLALKNEPIVEIKTDWYSETSQICNACVLYRARDLMMYFNETPVGNVMSAGWDCGFFRLMKRKYRQMSKVYSLVPSMVFHTGFTGTHTLGDDFNVNYGGDISRVVIR